MRKIAIAAAALMLAGCASVPQVNRAVKADKQSYTRPAKIVQPAPTVATTPNEIVKKRWYDRFKVHPKWFH